MSFEEKVNFAQYFNDEEANYENIEIPYYRRWLEPSQRVFIKEDISLGLSIPEDILLEFNNEERKWLKRVNHVKGLCYNSISFFISLSDEEKSKFLSCVKTEEFQIPLTKISCFNDAIVILHL